MKTYKLELTINIEELSIETKQKALTYGRSLLFTGAYALERLSSLPRYFTTTKEKVILPKHSLMCECRRCSPSTRTYYRKLKEA